MCLRRARTRQARRRRCRRPPGDLCQGGGEEGWFGEKNNDDGRHRPAHPRCVLGAGIENKQNMTTPKTKGRERRRGGGARRSRKPQIAIRTSGGVDADARPHVAVALGLPVQAHGRKGGIEPGGGGDVVAAAAVSGEALPGAGRRAAVAQLAVDQAGALFGNKRSGAGAGGG